MNFRVAAVALVPGLLLTGTAQAQTLVWSNWQSYDHGGYSAAAINGAGAGDTVEAHLGGSGGYYTDFDIWYDATSWGSGTWHGGDEIPPDGDLATGYYLGASGDPTTSSMLYGLIFGLMEQVDGKSYVYYQTGTLQTSNWTLNTSPSPTCYGINEQVNHGFNPTMAQGSLPNGQMYFFAVENGTNEGTTPAYATSAINFAWGTLNSDGCSISWNNGEYGTNIATGWNPSIAMWPINSNTFFIAVAYQASESINNNSELTMQVGQWTVGNSAPTWYNTYSNYGFGELPKIAVCNLGTPYSPQLMEVHTYYNSPYNDGLYYAGNITNWNSWSKSGENWLPGVDQDFAPSIACNTNWGLISTQQSNSDYYLIKFNWQ